MRSLRILLPLLLFSSVAFTGTPLSDEDLAKRIAQVQPDLPLEGFLDAEISGFKQVIFEGQPTWYISDDGEYIFTGDLWRVSSKDIINITEINRAKHRLSILSPAIMKDLAVTFSVPPGVEKVGFAWVFTDVDCPYCRAFHSNIGEYTSRGIEIRYLPFVRGGRIGPSYANMQKVWCQSEDRTSALADALKGVSLPPLECNNELQKAFETAVRAGVKGTPTILLEDGSLHPGLSAPDALLMSVMRANATSQHLNP